MRNILLAGLLLCLHSEALRAQIVDDFSDGSFSSDPIWSGNDSAFFINAEGLLQSQQKIPNSNFYLSIESSYSSHCEWTFSVNLDFNTSSANYVDVYLMSDRSDLRAAGINGYFVRLGGSSDELSLYKVLNGAASKVIDGIDGLLNHSTNKGLIKVTRSASGEFTLFRDFSSSNTYTLEGKYQDSGSLTPKAFGIKIIQSTTSFFGKHFFDELYIGPIRVDTIPPSVWSVRIMDTLQAKVEFTEVVDSSATEINHYLLNDSESPISCSLLADRKTILLGFNNAFLSGTQSFRIRNIADRAGNLLQDTLISLYYEAPYQAQPGDILLNELLSDPTPASGLPETEFVELWNTSSHTIPLTNWSYSDGSSTYHFGKDTIKPNEFLILCPKADTALFSLAGKVIGLSPWPSLNNSSDRLSLRSNKGVLIDSIAYSDTWYRDAEKKSGGYSLERIDPSGQCSAATHWSASLDSSGGTPGKTNSVRSLAFLPPKVSAFEIISNSSIALNFTSEMDSGFLQQSSAYRLAPTGAIPMVLRSSADFHMDTLIFEERFEKDILYTLEVFQPQDCRKNRGQDTSFSFSNSSTVRVGELLINEVLFNPTSGGVDFVELYNASSRTLDLSTLFIADKTIQGTMGDLQSISIRSLLIQPKQYIVITSDPSILQTHYYVPDTNTMRKCSLPGFNDDADAVILVDDSQQVVDRFDYSEKMHFSLIEDPDGISLERLRWDIPTQQAGNWHSASSNCGYATPGYRNSQAQDLISKEGPFGLSPERFSPDNDGYQDLLTLSYENDQPDLLIQIHIYTDKGVLIRKLVDSALLGESNTFTWDGSCDNGQKAPIGLYVVRAGIYDAKGLKEQYKKIAVVAAPLHK